MKTTTLLLDKDDIAVLREIAEYHGYLAYQGPTTGLGSASALLRAIAKGELATVLLGGEERREAVRCLREYDDGGWGWAESVADQLEAAHAPAGNKIYRAAQEIPAEG